MLSCERLDYTPLAITVTETGELGTNAQFQAALAAGFWQGEYLMGPAPWHRTLPGTGSLSGLSSADFRARYAAAFFDEPSTHAAWIFGLGLTLMDAIERAQSLDSNDVARALEATDFTDFMGRVKFDANHQNDIEMLVLQQPEFTFTDHVVFPTAVATIPVAYPTPLWRERRCRAYGPRQALNTSAVGVRLTVECNGNGLCNADGACVCNAPWEGVACDFDPSQFKKDKAPVIILSCVFGSLVFLGLSNAIRLQQKNAVRPRPPVRRPHVPHADGACSAMRAHFQPRPCGS